MILISNLKKKFDLEMVRLVHHDISAHFSYYQYSIKLFFPIKQLFS